MSSLIITVFSLSGTISISEARRAGKALLTRTSSSEIEIVSASQGLWLAVRENRKTEAAKPTLVLKWRCRVGVAST